MADLSDKVALVTGASSGIGEATARALAAAGATVVVAARRKKRLDTLVEEITKGGGKAMAIEADVVDEKVCQEVINKVKAAYKRLDILVNNAGVMLLGPVKDAPLEEWQRMVQVNLLGLLYMTYAALPLMRGSKGTGNIVNISSVAGRTVRAGSAVYNLTKWGVGAFTEALRQELAGDKAGIRTTLIEPGAVATELISHNRKEIQGELNERFADIKKLESEDIAAAILYAVSQPAHVSVNEILIRPTLQAA